MITRSSSGGPSGPAANEDAGRPAGAWRTAHAARPLALPRHRTKGWVWSVQWIGLELDLDWTGSVPFPCLRSHTYKKKCREQQPLRECPVSWSATRRSICQLLVLTALE